MNLTRQIAELQNYDEYQELHWDGSFEDYLTLVRKNPRVTRNSFQRMYDMVLAHGVEEYVDNKKKLTRYNFFKDETHGGRDAVYGLDVPLMADLDHTPAYLFFVGCAGAYDDAAKKTTRAFVRSSAPWWRAARPRKSTGCSWNGSGATACRSCRRRQPASTPSWPRRRTIRTV